APAPTGARRRTGRCRAPVRRPHPDTVSTMSHATEVLVVDDDQTILEHLPPVLRRSGLQVRCAQDGAEALREIDRARPDLVVLDVLMPGIDGRETLRRIRAQHEWLPVILLTEVGE